MPLSTRQVRHSGAQADAAQLGQGPAVSRSSHRADNDNDRHDGDAEHVKLATAGR